MKKTLRFSGILALAVALHGTLASGAHAAFEPVLLEGRSLYLRNCATCHGDQGNGKGPSAASLPNQPRDFTRGKFKFKSTVSGPPLLADLIRTIENGLKGTPMQGWKFLLSEAEIEAVARTIRTFTPVSDGTPTPVFLSPPPPPSPRLVSMGRELYQDAGCVECHGERGNGNGPKAASLRDDQGANIRPANFLKGSFKGGKSPEAIFLVLTTGMEGTPMPSYADSLPEESRWALAHFVLSLNSGKTIWDWLLEP